LTQKQRAGSLILLSIFYIYNFKDINKQERKELIKDCLNSFKNILLNLFNYFSELGEEKKKLNSCHNNNEDDSDDDDDDDDDDEEGDERMEVITISLVRMCVLLQFFLIF
jgi:hypothetical protein